MKNRTSSIPDPRCLLAAMLSAAALVSCVQPPPPRTYNASVARHLNHLSKDTPVNPIPGHYGWGWYGYHCGY